MSEYVFKLPDLGEGTVEAEIVEWHVKVGDTVKEGDVIVDVMTDKANVEVPAPVDGTVLRTSGEPGDVLAVGTELIAIDAAARAPRQGRQGAARPAPEADQPPARRQPAGGSEQPPADAGEEDEEPTRAESAESATQQQPGRPSADRRSASGPAGRTPAAAAPAPSTAADETPRQRDQRIITSPAIRRRAKEAGIDLHDVAGSGPRGRILRRDLDAALTEGPRPARGSAAPARSGPEFEAVKVIGVRRVIAERMSQSKREIPHFAYVEEVDVTELEALRLHLNERGGPRLSVLPFIGVGLIRALVEFPQCNARFSAEEGVLQRYHPVHLGIATQTPDGLKVPVVRDAGRLDLWRLAAAIAEVSQAARDGKAGRAELSGSTITITSLGRMGGVVTTPVINYPEVSIIGVNKVLERPVVREGQVTIRTMMNLSSSFDHRFVDGYDAAALIQRLKDLLEHPATLFLTDP